MESSKNIMTDEPARRAEAYLAQTAAPIAWASDEVPLAALDADERIVQVANCEMTPFHIPLYADSPAEAASIIAAYKQRDAEQRAEIERLRERVLEEARDAKRYKAVRKVFAVPNLTMNRFYGAIDPDLFDSAADLYVEEDTPND